MQQIKIFLGHVHIFKKKIDRIWSTFLIEFTHILHYH